MTKTFFQKIPNRFSKSLIGLSLLMLGTAATNADVIGKLSGEMSVNQGSLGYQLPLGVPAGIHGMKPELSLNYSQQGLTGSVGPGFSLSASSGITRCTPNMLNDEFEAGIQLDQLSRFCHDGQRLISISGTDGTNGAEYRTFDNDNVKYISNNGSNYTPASWTVKVPNGTTLTFERKGSNEDQFATWLLTSRSDVFANTISYQYSNDPVPLIESITYSGYEVDFQYEDKLEVIGQYQAGTYISTDKLLSKIVVNSPDESLLFSYDLTYEVIPGSTTSQRLKSVTQCFSDLDCLKPVEFGYQAIPDPTVTLDRSADQLVVIPKSAYTSSSTGLDETPVDERPFYSAADVNGDGFEDFCFYKVQSGIQCAIFDGTSYGSLTSWSDDLGYKSDDKAEADGEGKDAGDFKAYGALNLQDLNADGKADFCITDEQGVRCGLSDGSGFTNASYWTTNITNELSQSLLQRINDDEYLDVCGFDSSHQYKCYAGTGTGFTTTLATFTEPDVFNIAEWTYRQSENCGLKGQPICSVTEHEYDIKYPSTTWVDIDGDYDQDLCWVSESRQGFTCKHASTDPSTKTLTYGAPEVLIDLDGFITPLIQPSSNLVTTAAEQQSLIANNDDSARKSKALVSSFQYANLNGDNLVDICYVVNDELQCHINSGDGYLAATSWLDLTSLLSPYSGDDNEDEKRNAKISTFRFVDRNLDGRSDVCVIHSEIEQCAYNTGGQFQDFQDRLKIFPDIVASNELVEAWTSFMHKLFGGQRTHFRFQTVRAAYGNLVEVGDLNGDGYSEFCYRSIDGIVCSTNDNYGPTSLLTQVTDSYGLTTKVNYGSLISDDLYDAASSIPTGFYERPYNSLVVKNLVTDVATVHAVDGTQYTKQVEYRYGGYLVNPTEGIGGFTTMTEIQADRNVRAETQFYVAEESNKLFGQEKESRQYIDDVLVKYQRNDFSVTELTNGTRRLVLDETETKQYDLVGALISTNTTTNEQFDAYGRPQRVTLNKTHGTEALTTVTQSVYLNDTTNWILGKPTNQTVAHTQAGQTVTRTVDFTYTNGVLTEETIQAGAVNALTMVYSDFTTTGYPQRVETTGMALADGTEQTRSVTKTYDDLGRLLTETNALGQTIKYDYHATCGAVEYVTDIAGNKTKTTYNARCEKTKVEAPDDNETTWAYEWATADDNNPLNRPTTTLAGYDYYNPVVYKVTETKKTTSVLGDFSNTVYYDAQGRAVRTQSTGFSSQTNQRFVNTATLFDKYGYKTAQSRPYFSQEGGSNSIYWATMAYDATGRPEFESKMGPDGNELTTNYSYTGTSTTLSYSDYSKTTVNGIHGKPTSVTENGLTTEYEYSPMGDLLLTRTAGTLEVQVTYDDRGFKASQTDPSMGYWEYKHNAFGELVYQKDANNQVTTYDFDVLGRKWSRTAPEGTTSWGYYTSGNGIGQPSFENGVDASKTWQYDGLSRLKSETLTVNGKSFTTGYNYNNYSQLIETIQPNGVSIFHKYDNIGKLQNVSLLASDFQDVDFEFLEEKRADLAVEVERLRGLQAQALASAEYHQKKAVEYHNQYTYFVGELGKVTQELAELDAIAEAHRIKAEEYFELYRKFTAKAQELSEQYGGKTFKYDPDLDDGEYYYYSRTYCVSYHGWGPSRYCHKRQTDTVSVLQSEMKSGPKDNINPATFHGQLASEYEQLHMAESHAYNTLVKDASSSSVADMTATEVQEAIDEREEKIEGLEDLFEAERQNLINYVNSIKKYDECIVYMRRNPMGYDSKCHNSIKSEILAKVQAAILETSGCNISIDFVNTTKLNNLCMQAIQPRAEINAYQSTPLSAYFIPQEEEYTEEVMVPIMVGDITTMIPAMVNKIRIIQVEVSANDAVAYYTAKRNEAYANMEKAIADAQASMDLLDSGINDDLMTAEASLALIEESMGVVDSASLDSLLTSQANLATTQGRLTVWHAANRTPEGHLQTEMFGNGLYTHRDINNETGVVTNIRTGAVLGSTIRDLAYEYDARGRIISKIDSSAHTDGSFDINTEETFSYNDAQGRLSDWSFSQTVNEEVYDPASNSTSTVTRQNHLSAVDYYYEHDDLGNLTYKASAGTMSYDPLTNRLESRTHNGVTSSYSYDNNGNMKIGDGRSYVWTSFNKAASISMTGAPTVNFIYDASHKRKVKQTANETRYYVNPGYELVERSNADGTTETVHRYTIFHEHDQVAVFEKTETSAAVAETDQASYADSISYVHRDILGSGELVTDSRMNILARQFFSPYGEKVDDLLKAQDATYQAAKLGAGMIQSDSTDLGADLWAKYEQAGEGDAFMSRFTAGSSALDLSGVRGFTSHETIQEIGLINMNARLYDPVLGRFMSADSMVPDLYTPLDHNRYAYVRGNPVVIRDPSGHFPWLAAAAAFFAWTHYGDNPQWQMAGTVVLSAAMMNPSTSAFAQGVAMVDSVAIGVMRAGVTSLTISYLKSGKIDRTSMENAGIAMLSAGLTYSIAHGWIGDNLGLKGGEFQWAKITAAHMVTQGAIADLRGDKFIHGAISGLTAKVGGYLVGPGGATEQGLGTLSGTVVVSTLSGVTSEATGGDFAEGALTGAIIHLYNDLSGRMGRAAKLREQRLMNKEPGFFVQAGVVGNSSAGVFQGSVEKGMYVGTLKSGEFESGLYITFSGGGNYVPTAGFDGGLKVGFSNNMSVENLDGWSGYVGGGIDTVLDVQVEVETVYGKGNVYNISITAGPDFSAALIASGGGGQSRTYTIPLTGPRAVWK